MASLSPDELIGHSFAHWTVIGPDPNSPHTISRLLCKCCCGTQRIVRYSHIRSGASKSCGCQQSHPVKHGLSSSVEHRVWRGMNQRCSNASEIQWKDYGGRGITVCERWKGSDGFANFLSDMGPRPLTPLGLKREWTIERRDVNGSYCPENCYWSNYTKQNNNKRNSRLIEYEGQFKTASEWGREKGFAPGTIIQRISNGWSIHRALNTPVAKQSGKKPRSERIRRK